MSRRMILVLTTLAAGASMVNSADARYYESRRENRREAIVAGAVRHGIASERADANYRECLRESDYDQACERQHWADEQAARRKGRRTAIVVGAY